MPDLEPIHKEIAIQLEAVHMKERRASSVDIKDLVNELMQVEFKPEYATDLGTTTVRVGDWQTEIHQTRNFPTIFRAADFMVRRSRQPDPVIQAVFESSQAETYDEIFRRLKMQHPTLYLRMREVADNVLDQEITRTRKDLSEDEKIIRAASDEEKAEWALIASYAYGAAADIARSINPEYNLRNLYLQPAP